MGITAFGPLDSLMVAYKGNSASVQRVEENDATTQSAHLELTLSLL